MKSLRTYFIRLLTVAFSSILIPIGATAQSQISIKTRYMSLAYSEGGTFSMVIPSDNGQQPKRIQGIGLFLDGHLQKGFRLATKNGEQILVNNHVTVSLDATGNRSIAIDWSANDHQKHKFDVRINVEGNDNFFGGGERFNSIKQLGYILPVQNDDRPSDKGVGTYASIPFLMSTQGYGIWVESYATGSFDIAATDHQYLDLKYPEKKLRVVFMAGPDMKDILNEFTRLTSRPKVPPVWSFGLWKSRDVFQNRDSVLVDVHKLRRFDIPASVIVFDSPWETGYNNFEINRQQFTHPEQLFHIIKENGFYSALWFTPMINSKDIQDMKGITPVSSNYEEATQKGYLVHDSAGNVVPVTWWKGTGGLVDLTNPKAKKWWIDQLSKTQKLDGVRAFKLDDGEGVFVPSAKYYDGTPAWRMKNRYPTLYHQTIQTYIDSVLGGNGVLLNRSGFTGIQRFPFLWAGDNRSTFSFKNGFPTVILAGQNAGLSGIPFWGSDISGYINDGKRPTKEVFIRWTQFGAFSPFMQVHMTSNLGPWDFDHQTLNIFRTYAKLHTDLLPYILDAAREAHETGMPVIRAMALAFQDDSKAADYPYQYMFGPDFLVAPMYRGGTSRVVYLPGGTWFDYWNGKSYTGPKTIDVKAPLSQIPLFVRAGAIIPMLPENIQTLVPRNREMKKDIVSISDVKTRILQIWPGDSGSVSTTGYLSASFHKMNNEIQLTITDDSHIPVTLEIMHRHVTARTPGLTVRFDSRNDQSVIKLPAFKGSKTLILQIKD